MSFFSSLLALFREPMPVLSYSEWQRLTALEDKLDQITAKVDQLAQRQLKAQGDAPNDTPAPASTMESQMEDLANQVRKLAKTQFKTNNLHESQLANSEAALDALNSWQDALETQAQGQIDKQQASLLKKLLPVADSLDAAYQSGKQQVTQLNLDPQTKQSVIAWLDGVRLARIRLLDLLASYDITPIDSIDQPFNPHQHIAVGTARDLSVDDGTIVSQDRVGYRRGETIVREAEVVVARH